MARKYSKKAAAKVGRAMKKRKSGPWKSGRSGRKVKSRKPGDRDRAVRGAREGSQGAEEKAAKKRRAKR